MNPFSYLRGLPDQGGRMIGSRSGCLPVVEDGKLLGIVTTTDLMHIVSGSPSASSKEVPAFAGSKE